MNQDRHKSVIHYKHGLVECLLKYVTICLYWNVTMHVNIQKKRHSVPFGLEKVRIMSCDRVWGVNCETTISWCLTQVELEYRGGEARENRNESQQSIGTQKFSKAGFRSAPLGDELLRTDSRIWYPFVRTSQTSSSFFAEGGNRLTTHWPGWGGWGWQ